jgi:uncharacterized SAM-binding protein YcdF (DUF218 family)
VAATFVAFLALAAFVVPRAGVALVTYEAGPPPDAIVSLASHEWERLPEAIAQAAAHPRALVVLTIPEHVTIYNCHDCGHRGELLIDAGVHVSRIRQIRVTSGGTFGEALAMKRFMTEYNLKHLLVVTSPYHTRRSLATFRAVFADTPVTIGVLPATAYSPARPKAWWWSDYDRAYVRYEWAAVLYYWIKYHVPMTV